MILFITNKEDLTIDFLINKLNRDNVNYFRLNTEDFPQNLGFNFNFKDNKFTIIDYIKNIEINIEDINSVYYRRPKLSEINFKRLNKGRKKFLLDEITYCFEGLYKLMRNKYWLNKIFAIREAENKMYQLLLAKEIGFRIPNSLITNSNSAHYFFNNEDEYIIKPIRTGYIDSIKSKELIFTNLFTKDQTYNLKRVKIFPNYFQEKVNKIADIRVTVVGNKIFSALIKSQEFEETKVDWRRNEEIPLQYEKIELPELIRKKCLKLNKILNLNFSTMDFALKKNKDYIFFEINPNGQWAWIEKKLKFNISQEIINLLTQKI